MRKFKRGSTGKSGKRVKLDGRTSKNDYEVKIYRSIEDVLPRKASVVYEAEKLPYVVEHDYIPDLIVTKRDGTKIYIEVKGNGLSFDTAVKQKMIAIKKQYPELDIRIVFYSDGKCGNKRKDGTFMRQSDWATKYGFKYAIKVIPDEWIEEMIQ